MKNLLLVVALLLIACHGGPKFVEDSAIETALVNHFEDAGGVQIDSETRASFRTNSNLLVGTGTIESRNGSNKTYKWAFITDDDGGLSNGFIGTVGSSSAATPNLSEDETRDALKRCSARYPDAQDMFDCFDRVVDKVIRDCDNAFPDEAQCRIHCWYQDGECFS